MLEIIALVFLCKRNGALAEKKGLKPGTWKMYTVLGWILAEFVSLFIGMAMFGKESLIAVLAIGLFGAFGGYLFVRYILENKPDAAIEDDIRQIGVDDLHPPKNHPNNF